MKRRPTGTRCSRSALITAPTVVVETSTVGEPAGDFDRFREATHFHRDRQIDALPEADDDVLLLGGLEALEFGPNRVGAGRQEGRVETSLRVRREGLRSPIAGDGHRGAGHCEPLWVGHATGDGPRCFLGPAVACRGDDQCRHEGQNARVHQFSLPLHRCRADRRQRRTSMATIRPHPLPGVACPGTEHVTYRKSLGMNGLA